MIHTLSAIQTSLSELVFLTCSDSEVWRMLLLSM